MLIDLPFALPTIVAGLVLLSLYGPQQPARRQPGVHAGRRLVALLFVTLPFVVRTVQPVLLELDPQMEEAAASRSAPASSPSSADHPAEPAAGDPLRHGARVRPAISEFGSTVLISGNLPFKTAGGRGHIFNQIQSDNPTGRRAVSTVLLVVALVVLILLNSLQRWGSRRGHEARSRSGWSLWRYLCSCWCCRSG
jgi:sulfate transport system permease protein